MCCCLITLGCVGLLAYAYFWYSNWKANQVELRKKVERRRQERAENIEKARKSAASLNVELRDKIAAWDFEELRNNLQKGTITCVDAVKAFQWKALKAHEITNCVTQFVTEAVQWAEEWDEKAKDPSFKKPNLFGVPISVKECFGLKGYDTTQGFVQKSFEPCQRDSNLLVQVKRTGCIPFVKTNVPQSMVIYNCANPVYGITNHPLSKDRTPGGSSGGEGAIIGANGSLLGIGGDGGGSIRIPASFNGIAGFKSSQMRMSHIGTEAAVPGKPMVNHNEGPMAKDVKACVEFYRGVWRDTFYHEVDPYVPPITFNESLYQEGRKYRIGYYTDDGFFTPTHPFQRAVLEAKEHLERAGHTLVPFSPPDVSSAIGDFARASVVDGGRFLRNRLTNDIIDRTLYANFVLWFMPIFVFRIAAFVMDFVYPRLSILLRSMSLDTRELRQTYQDIDRYRNRYFVAMRDKNLDAILCPSMVMPAPEHMAPGKVILACCYTGLFNMLDYGAGVVNVTKITEDDDRKLAEHPVKDPWDKIVLEQTKGTVGYPVNVQIAAPPYSEEIALRLLRDIEIGVTGK